VSLLQCTAAGELADALHGEIHVPKRGAWWANLALDTRTVPALKSSATVAAVNGLSLTGTIAKAGIFNDTTFVHVVGGAGGVGLPVGPFAFQNCLFSDPLGAILSAARETQSTSIATSLLRMNLGTWTVTQNQAGMLLDELCYVAQLQLGGEVNWRTLGDGTVWVGQETWSSASLPPGADVILQHPVNPWFEIACETPALLPGVNLTDIGNLNVAAVDHWVEDRSVRTWAWTS